MSISKNDVIEALKTVDDPDLGLDIYFLGLIYDIDIKEDVVIVTMTFTTPLCPMAPYIIQNVKDAVGKVDGVKETEVKIVFEPAWEPREEIKEYFGF
ncbi:MAG: metal-sulfur cluster assembly factor [Bdellovibrionota bacterium]